MNTCFKPGLILCYDLAKKKDMRFGTWNGRSLNGADSLPVAARELARSI